MAVRDPALMNAALAVAASHHSRWQHTADTASRKYLGAAAKALRDRFNQPDQLNSQVTLAAMLLLVSFEVGVIKRGVIAPSCDLADTTITTPSRCFPVQADGEATTMPYVDGFALGEIARIWIHFLKPGYASSTRNVP